MMWAVAGFAPVLGVAFWLSWRKVCERLHRADVEWVQALEHELLCGPHAHGTSCGQCRKDRAFAVMEQRAAARRRN